MPGDESSSARPSAPPTSCRPSRRGGSALVADVRRRGPRASASAWLITPIFEHLEVFQRVGESTDVVRKEMYDFEDKGGRRARAATRGHRAGRRGRSCSTSRRCRGRSGTSRRTSGTSVRRRAATASTGRSASRCWASTIPTVDVEVIALAHGFYRDLGLRDVALLLNSMGDDADRAPRTPTLLLDVPAASTATRSATSSASGPRPTRCGSSTRSDPDWQDMHRARAAARRVPQRRRPRRTSRRCRTGSHALGIAFEIDPRLVRGFDYYTSTTFEFQSDALDAAQNAIGGGGRYDGLAEQMGGPPTPGIGFGIGIERVLHRVRRRRAWCPRADADRRRVRRRRRRTTAPRSTLLVDRAARGRARAPTARYGGRSVKGSRRRPTGRARRSP